MQPVDRSLLEARSAAIARAVVDPTPSFLDAWRQLHYAAQIASEVGKSWAIARDDDSHSAFEWRAGELLGAPAADAGARAALRANDLTVRLVAADGAELASKPLHGATLADGTRWIRDAAERIAGPPRQPATPAPDLPPHAIATGAAFSAPTTELASLSRLLDGADALLRVVGPQPRIWPHHFDIATLVEVGPQRTIGVGLAPPDGLDPSGYWYVSPWSGTPLQVESIAWPTLATGRWIERGGSLRIAVFPLDALATVVGEPARSEALVAFLAAAIEASDRNLAR